MLTITRLTPFLLPLCLVATLAPPREARACTPAPEKPFTVPSNRSSSPANAALIFSGYPAFYDADISAGALAERGVTVTVDGAAASLVFVDDLNPDGPFKRYPSRENAFFVSPEPKPGQRVVVRGPDCGPRDPLDPSNKCPPFELSYTATEPDVAPPVVPAVTYEARLTSGGGCNQGDGEPVQIYSVHFSAPLEGGAAAPVVYLVEWFRDATSADRIGFSTVRPDRSNFGVALAGGEVGCVRIQALDLAGNESQPVVECALPPLPPLPLEKDESGQKALKGQLRDDGCQLSGAVGARPAPWAGLVAASAFFAGWLRRRDRARRG